jgi:hypothetical protein
MNRDNVNRDNIAGFMVGVSVGVAIGFFLKPPEETESRVANQRTDYLRQHSDRGSRPEANRPEKNDRTVRSS